MEKRPSFAPILLTTFLDLLGMTLVFPIMAPLFVGNKTGLFGPDVSEGTRDIVMGFLLGTYPMAQFFGAPILGALSDRFGRKPILLISIAVSFIGYVLFGTAIVTNNLTLLFISRFLPGFMGGNISVIFSAVSDLSTPEERPKNFGLVGMIFGLGFILGPAIGGFLSDSNMVSWFSYDTPLWATAILSFINLIVIWRIFPETLKHKSQTPYGITSGLKNLGFAFSLPNLRWILISLFLGTLGFSFFTQFFQVFLQKKFDFDAPQIGPYFGYVGLWIAFAQGVIVRRLAGKVAPEKLVTIFAFILACAIPMLLLPDHWSYLLLITPFIAVSQGIQGPNLMTIVSLQATREQQGSILGINQSMQSLGQALPCFAGGFLSSINYRYPMLAASFFVLMGWGVFLLFRLNNKSQKRMHFE